ncbi:MAG: hypothetical protein AAF390_06730 [Pseudomonadota bacterium]
MVMLAGLLGIALSVALITGLPSAARATPGGGLRPAPMAQGPSSTPSAPASRALFTAPSAAALLSQAHGTAGGPPVLAEFDLGGDRLEISHDGASGMRPAVAIETNGTDTSIAVDGEVVAHLPGISGLTAEHLTFVPQDEDRTTGQLA